MSYTVLARKYRPQTFADMVGQEHVSRTLGNAIKSGRIAHAFLLTGARGVGKTTTARLLAKALNCEQGPTPEPCNACDPCREITNGVDMDVLEIDGASNNSVDDVRRLQESLPYRPSRDRFKVVIVDEVHMLSTGAFNAFLKTLEEPPPHVKFIFATTEIHKVPITIRSRCQRHDFRLIPHHMVAEHVRKILAQENVTADDEAIAIVVREAGGSLRDALTVLEQLLAFGGNSLRGEEVARGLGIADQQSVLATARALLDGDAAACVRAVATLGEQGLDVMHFARELLWLARDMVVLRVVGDDERLVDRPTDERNALAKVAAEHAPQQLERTFSGLSKLIDEAAESATPQLALEMGLVRLADRPPLQPLAALLDRLQALEARLLGGGGPSAGPGAGGGG
ncbi:MAG TPA: DNA polymerase III subunit gamma/tau, partial [Polyangiales bacterium]|nr:DNA polymerase III subunit gamma/tau [Polyangiales bacterium]